MMKPSFHISNQPTGPETPVCESNKCVKVNMRLIGGLVIAIPKRRQREWNKSIDGYHTASVGGWIPYCECRWMDTILQVQTGK